MSTFGIQYPEASRSEGDSIELTPLQRQQWLAKQQTGAAGVVHPDPGPPEVPVTTLMEADTRTNSPISETSQPLFEVHDLGRPDPWEYTLARVEHPHEVEHRFSSHTGRSIAITPVEDQFYVRHCQAGTPIMDEGTRYTAYADFQTALSAAVGTLEWGSLPQAEPRLWDYSGYTTGDGGFRSYVSDQTTGLRHYLKNRSANYQVAIHTHRVQKGRQMLYPATLTIRTGTSPGTGTVMFRGIYQGQQAAWTTFLQLVASKLSHSLQRQEYCLKEYGSVPPLSTLLRSHPGGMDILGISGSRHLEFNTDS